MARARLPRSVELGHLRSPSRCGEPQTGHATVPPPAFRRTARDRPLPHKALNPSLEQKWSSRWASAWLRFPKGSYLALGVALVLALPGMMMGVFMDDYLHLALMRGLKAPGSAFDLFRFAPGDAELIAPFIKHGPFPWWTLPELKFAFWRPLSSALANVDFALFGDALWAYHLHSIVWHLALVAAAAVLYRRILPPALGAGALLLFAVAPAHILPTMWLANRNSLVSMVPALLGLAAHLRWREEGWKPGLPLSVLGFAVALSGGESSLGVFAYLATFELFSGPGGARRKVLALVPAGVLGLLYVILYRSLNLGAVGSAIYIDPGAAPLAYLAAVPGRIAALLGNQIAGLPADLWLISPALRPLQVGVGCVFTAGFALLLRRAWPGLEERERRALRWLVGGACLSMLPFAATFPMTRLLLVPSLGAAAAMAVLLRHALRGRSLDRAAGAYLALIHLGVAVLAWPAHAVVYSRVADRTRDAYLSAEVDASRTPSQRHILLVAPDPSTGLYPPMVRLHYGHPVPESWWVLSYAPYPHRFTRTAADAFELQVVGGRMLESVFEQLVRAEDRPLPLGEPIELAGLTVTVLEAEEGAPTRVGFKSDRPLDDPSLWFLQWRDKGLRHFVVPAVGQSVLLPSDYGVMEP